MPVRFPDVLQFDLTAADLIAYSRYRSIRTPVARTEIWISRGLILVALLSIALAPLANQTAGSIAVRLLALALVGLVAWFIPLWAALLVAPIRGGWEAEHTRAVGHWKVTLLADGLELERDGENGHFGWNDFVCVDPGRDATYVYYKNARQALIIPHRALPPGFSARDLVDRISGCIDEARSGVSAGATSQ